MEKVAFKLGSDPELFLRDVKTKELRSAIPVIREGKGMGRHLGGSKENRVLHDNVLVEFNTEPAGSKEQFVQTIGSVLKSISEIVGPKGLELHLQTSADFPEKELADPEAKIFGCDPDFDAYLLAINQISPAAATKPLRSAGGHLHIGVDETDETLRAILDDAYGKVNVVKALDVFVGLPSVFLDKDPTAPRRRALYGRAGSHRPKEYGVEYRASGNWWLKSPRHAELVYRLSEAALSQIKLDGALEKLINQLGGEEVLQAVINESKVVEARKLYGQHLAPLLDEQTRQLAQQLDMDQAIEFYPSWKLG